MSFNDLLVHFAGYAVLFLSAKVAFPARDNTRMLFLLLFGYSVLIEVMQHFVPNRTFSVADMLANGLGLLVGFCVYAILAKLRDRSSELGASP